MKNGGDVDKLISDAWIEVYFSLSLEWRHLEMQASFGQNFQFLFCFIFLGEDWSLDIFSEVSHLYM